MEHGQKHLQTIDSDEQVWPSLHGELELSHEYADTRRFSDDQIIDRLAHYEDVERRGELTARAMGQVALIRSFLWFEFDQREQERRGQRVSGI